MGCLWSRTHNFQQVLNTCATSRNILHGAIWFRKRSTDFMRQRLVLHLALHLASTLPRLSQLITTISTNWSSCQWVLVQVQDLTKQVSIKPTFRISTLSPIKIPTLAHISQLNSSINSTSMRAIPILVSSTFIISVVSLTLKLLCIFCSVLPFRLLSITPTIILKLFSLTYLNHHF